MDRLILALVIVASTASGPLAQSLPETVFAGLPMVKISEGGIERLPETLPRERAVNLRCVISRIGNQYYWASRENKPLVRHETGSFVTFVAPDGAGYVRVIRPESKLEASIMSDTETESIYRRYHIVAEADIHDAGAQLDALTDKKRRGGRRRPKRTATKPRAS